MEPPTPPAQTAPPPEPGGHAPARVDGAAAAGLRARTVRGGAVALLSQGCAFVLLFGLQVVLARLLTPEDFGLVAVVTSVVTFFSLFGDLGLTTATVQRREITHEQVSLLFWLNAAWGVALALLTAASALPFAWLYGEPRVAAVIAALAAVFVFTGVASQHRALLRRRLRFASLALVDLLALFAGAAAAVASALHGYRYWALVHMRLVTAACATLGLLLASRWRPGRPGRGAHVRPLLAFGRLLTGFDVTAYVTRHADNLVIGWYSGTHALGFYYKAYQMLLAPAQQIVSPLGAVVIPALSRLQAEPRRYGAYYHRAILLSSAAGMPPVAFLFVGAEWVVPLLLGEQWGPSVPLFHALALAAFIGPVESGSGWLVASLGRARRQFRLTLLTTAVTLAGFLVGIRWGAFGVALSFSLCRAAFLVPKLKVACEGAPVRWPEIFLTAARPAACSLAAAAGLFALTRQFDPAAHGLAGLAAGGLCFTLMYIGFWSALPGGRRSLRSLLRMARHLRK
jgi:PST family polysaccharide transporter